MKVTYHEKTDLLYISLEDSPDQVVDRRVDADVVLDPAEATASPASRFWTLRNASGWIDFFLWNIRKRF
jgi:hypothetical protein